MDRGACLGEPPGRARMIEMNVTKKDMANVVRRKAGATHRAGNGFESGIRPGIEQGNSVVGFKRGRRDDSRPTEMQGIENVNHFLKAECGMRSAE